MTVSDSSTLAADANAQLEAHYDSILGRWNVLRKQQESLNRTLSIPCFVKANPAYFSAKPKIVFVGQETHGWWTNCEKDKALLTGQLIGNFYNDEVLKLFQTYRSPYWSAVREITKNLNVNIADHSFINTNVFPCDVDKKRAPLELHKDFRSWEVLPKELTILKPEYVVFFCGREYYGNLESYFGKMPKQYVSTATPLVDYQPQGASWKGFVTYHPNYLKRSKRWNVIHQIIDRIKVSQSR